MALVETTRPHDRIDAEARGKMRVFKQAVASTAAALDRVIAEERALRAATRDLARKRGVGQQRAFRGTDHERSTDHTRRRIRDAGGERRRADVLDPAGRARLPRRPRRVRHNPSGTARPPRARECTDSGARLPGMRPPAIPETTGETGRGEA